MDKLCVDVDLSDEATCYFKEEGWLVPGEAGRWQDTRFQRRFQSSLDNYQLYSEDNPVPITNVEVLQGEPTAKLRLTFGEAALPHLEGNLDFHGFNNVTEYLRWRFHEAIETWRPGEWQDPNMLIETIRIVSPPQSTPS